VQLSPGMIEPWDSTLHVSRRRRISLRFDSQKSDNVDSLARGGVLKSDLCFAHRMDHPDSGTVEFCHSSTRSAKEDVRQGIGLRIVGAIIDVENDLPSGTRLNVVEVSDRKDRTQAAQVDSIGMARLDKPRQCAKAHPVR